jgi:hypothetical protein
MTTTRPSRRIIRRATALIASMAAVVAMAACTPPPVTPVGDWALVGGPVVTSATSVSNISRLDPSGDPVVAWSTGGQTSSQISVSAWRANAWVQLGGQLNATTAAYLTGMELDSDGNPYVAWTEGGSGYVSHWDGTAWHAIGTPIANIVNQDLFIASGSPLTIGYYQANGLPPLGRQLFIGTWTGSSWMTTGPRNLPNYTTAFPVAVTLDGADPVVAWQGLQPNNFIWSYVVERYTDGAWADLGPVFSNDANYTVAPVVLVARNGSIDLAWSESGYVGTTHGVVGVINSYVDQWDGSAWQALGGNLGAQAPEALIFDAAGNLTVARAGSNSVSVATWTGAAWAVVGSAANVGLTVQSTATFSLSRSAHAMALSWIGGSSSNEVRVSRIQLS